MPKELKNNLWISVPFVILAGVFAATQGAIAKHEIARLSGAAVFFFRFSIGFFLISLWTVTTSRPKTVKNLLKAHQKKLFVLRAVTGGAASLLYYYALSFISLSSATVLFQTIPVFVPIVSRIWLKIKIHQRSWFGLGVAFLGIVLIVRPDSTLLNPGSFLALGSGVLGAISSVSARRLHYTESSQRIIWYYFFLVTLISTVYFAMSWFFKPITIKQEDVVLLLLLGLSGLAFQYLFVVAVRFSPARLVTPFIYFSLVFTLLLDIFYYKIIPHYTEYVGMLCVIVGVVLIVWLFPKNEPIVYVKGRSTAKSEPNNE